MKKRSLLAYVLISVLGVFVLFGGVYALFGRSVSSEDIAFEVNNQTSGMTQVGSHIELAKMGQYAIFNSTVAISDPTSRKKIQFSHDITLTSDVIVTADVSLDLNGKTLNLNGRNLYIRHNFFGSMIIENGTIVDISALGKVIVQTPNATPEMINLTNASQFVVIETFESNTTAQVVFSQVNAILTKGPAQKYHHKDVVLPHNYFNSDMEFSYVSSHPAIFDAFGHINTSGIATEQAVSVSLTLTTPDLVVEQSFSITIIPLSNQNRWLEVAAQLVVDYIQPYYNETTTTYQISKSMMLLPENEYIGITYAYQVLQGGVVNPSLIAPNGYILQASVIAQNLKLQITPKFSALVYLNPAREVTLDFVVPMTKYDLASYIVEETFGSYIFFNDIGISYSLIDLSLFPNADIVNIEYSMSQPNYYYINTAANMITSIADSSNLNIYLNIVFEFADTTRILRRVRTIFSQVGEIDPFDAYYNELRQLFQVRTNDNYTYNSFYLPARIELGETAYLVQYSVASAYPTLPSGSQNVLQILPDSANNRYEIHIDKPTIPLDNTIFAISIQYVLEGSAPSTPYTPYGTDLGFILPGVVRNNALGIPNLNLYTAIDTVFNNTLDRSYGLLLRDSLYQSLDLSVPSMGITNFKGIELLPNLRSLIANNNSFGSSSTNLTHLSGLGNLKTLNLASNGISTFATQITLRSLTTLNLSNNTISYTNFPKVPNLENLDLSKNRLASVETLPVFEKLKTLDVSNNSILFFYPLEIYGGLTSLHTYNNGVYNTTNQTYNTVHSNELYNKETLVFINYMYNTSIYNSYASGAPVLTQYTAADKTRSKVLRGIMYVSTTVGTTNAAIDKVIAQLPTTIVSYGNVSHTVSYIKKNTTMFLSQYVSGGVQMQRIMLINI